MSKEQEIRPSHTPGPWKTKTLQAVTAIENFNGSRICSLAHRFEDERGYSIGSIEAQDKSQAMIGANARLIAAAPDMYEALIDLSKCFPRDKTENPWKKAVDAIAKAEGINGQAT
jgi:hypothetical protein